jgi:hypothetical protein
MKPLHPSLKPCLPVALLAWMMILPGCFSTQTTSIERDKQFQTSKLHKALIISTAQQPEIRHQVENEFVRQWKKKKVEAVASHAVLTPNVPFNREGIASFAHSQGYDTVLVTRLNSLKPISKTPETHETKEPASPAQSANMTQYFDAVVASPDAPIDYEVAEASIRVFEVSTERLLWSCHTQTLVTGDIPKHIQSFVETVLDTMYEKSKD